MIFMPENGLLAQRSDIYGIICFTVRSYRYFPPQVAIYGNLAYFCKTNRWNELLTLISVVILVF